MTAAVPSKFFLLPVYRLMSAVTARCHLQVSVKLKANLVLVVEKK